MVLDRGFLICGVNMKVKFTPELCKGEQYSGHVVLKMPSYADRISFYNDDIIDETTGEPGAEPQTDAEKHAAKRRQSKKGKAIMESVGRRLGDFVSEVNIVRKKDGFTFNSFDQLNYDSDMIAVLTECSQRLIGKYEVGVPQ